MTPHAHEQVPTNPKDGERFDCLGCDYSAEFVVLDDGLPGEWVSRFRPGDPDA